LRGTTLERGEQEVTHWHVTNKNNEFDEQGYQSRARVAGVEGADERLNIYDMIYGRGLSVYVLVQTRWLVAIHTSLPLFIQEIAWKSRPETTEKPHLSRKRLGFFRN
jgi:hypothetical protein